MCTHYWCGMVRYENAYTSRLTGKDRNNYFKKLTLSHGKQLSDRYGIADCEEDLSKWPNVQLPDSSALSWEKNCKPPSLWMFWWLMMCGSVQAIKRNDFDCHKIQICSATPVRLYSYQIPTPSLATDDWLISINVSLAPQSRFGDQIFAPYHFLLHQTNVMKCHLHVPRYLKSMLPGSIFVLAGRFCYEPWGKQKGQDPGSRDRHPKIINFVQSKGHKINIL